MRVGVLIIAVLLASVAAGCGSSPTKVTALPHREKAGNCTVHTPQQRAQLRQLQADIVGMRQVAAPVKKRTLMGTPGTQTATDRFIRHADASALPVYVKSRLFDHAVAAISPACEQCFQWLEADRPVGGGGMLAQSC